MTQNNTKKRQKVTLVIPTLRRYDLLLRAVTSAYHGTLTPTHTLVIDNGIGMPPHIRDGLETAVRSAGNGAALEVVAPGYNMGVAAAWNLGLHKAQGDWTIISNDDVTFYRDTLQYLVQAAEAQPDELFLFPGTGGFKNAWSMFLQRQRMHEVVGWYDEWISPGYGFYEDNDMAYRLKRAGYRHVPVQGCAYAHVDSATVKSMARHEQADHWQRFERAKQRYVTKWGGEPGRERYTMAFNGTPPAGYRCSVYDKR